MTNDYANELDNVLLAWSAYRGPLPEPGPIRKRTIRQRIRIWGWHKRGDIEQWIHDHLSRAHCD